MTMLDMFGFGSLEAKNKSNFNAVVVEEKHLHVSVSFPAKK